MVDELSGSKGSRDIANLPYFSESVDLDLILAFFKIADNCILMELEL